MRSFDYYSMESSCQWTVESCRSERIDINYLKEKKSIRKGQLHKFF